MGIILNTFDINSNWDRLVRESRFLQSNVLGGDAGLVQYGSSSTVSVGSLVSPGKVQYVPQGRCYLVNSITILGDAECVCLVRFKMINTNFSVGATDTELGTYEQHWCLIPSGGGTVTIPFTQLKILPEGTVISIQYWKKTGSTTQAVFVECVPNGIDITNDLNFSAKKVFALLSDSVGHTAAGNNVYGDEYWPFLLKNRFLDDGKSIRLVNKAFGGATSTTAVQLVRNGYLNFPFDFLMISIGYNDAARTSSSWASFRATFKSNMTKIIDCAKRANPNSIIMVCQPYSPWSTDTNRVSNMADVRLALQEVQQSYNPSKKIFLGSFAGAYTGSDSSYFNASESPNYVHPNATGHAALYNTIYSQISGTSQIYSNL